MKNKVRTAYIVHFLLYCVRTARHFPLQGCIPHGTRIPSDMLMSYHLVQNVWDFTIATVAELIRRHYWKFSGKAVEPFRVHPSDHFDPWGMQLALKCAWAEALNVLPEPPWLHLMAAQRNALYDVPCGGQTVQSLVC